MNNLRAVSGHWWCAEGGGGGDVNATRTSASAWELFRVASRSPQIAHGDSIALRARNGQYVYAQNGGGGRLYAKGAAIGDWELLTVHNLDQPGGRIRSGQRVELQAPNGQFVYAQGGGGGRLYAGGAEIGDWEPFKLDVLGERDASVRPRLVHVRRGRRRPGARCKPRSDEWNDETSHQLSRFPR